MWYWAYNLDFPAHYSIKALATAPGIIILWSFLFHSCKTSAPVCNVCLILVQLCQNPNIGSADKWLRRASITWKPLLSLELVLQPHKFIKVLFFCNWKWNCSTQLYPKLAKDSWSLPLEYTETLLVDYLFIGAVVVFSSEMNTLHIQIYFLSAEFFVFTRATAG